MCTNISSFSVNQKVKCLKSVERGHRRICRMGLCLIDNERLKYKFEKTKMASQSSYSRPSYMNKKRQLTAK